ncbi:MAG: aminoacyl-histidine dipeptidase [Paludibacteraceae bacterium]|nr:aminoacyl-histidine dipeptidase [Paludibacteraceae bacterium]
MITTLEPKELFYYFNEICKIPRPSKKEEKMRAFLVDFGKKNNLETVVDKTGNVLIRKTAPKGYEHLPTVILQSHIDMVCEKNSDVVHNFEEDAIIPYIDGEWIKAKGTTLGADNGIGMAAMLAVLASDNLQHGNLECLFTYDEETGLTGAFNLEKDFLTGKILINLDSEEDGEFFIGCAGGIDTVARINYQTEKADEKMFFFNLNIKGLKGGHSGDDINKGRGNANKILARFLWNTSQKTDLRIVKIDGGNLRNAIAREASVTAAVPFSYREPLRIDLNLFIYDIETELKHTEPDLEITLESESVQKEVIDKETSTKLLNMLMACPHGVVRMSDAMPQLVETSTNLASIRMEDSVIEIATSQRSSVESAKLDIASVVESVFLLGGAKVFHNSTYPGWCPNPSSEIVKTSARVYKNLFKKEPKIRAIHAGLECGLFLEKYPHLDMVSFGPTMQGVHSPDERLHIGSTQRFWTLLTSILKEV